LTQDRETHFVFKVFPVERNTKYTAKRGLYSGFDEVVGSLEI
jgi:hypothetical protein